ncbi:hypothetical protein OUZ56_012121 [Daphnia magna]|uniref:Uncharacterized protein n=1 Tax=Daphnia magna TaxID=35525 RepID=A0ABQ9Z231_9CRUS|nr:hypothetical protein OUZ56_012121 [Daphnia magna]
MVRLTLDIPYIEEICRIVRQQHENTSSTPALLLIEGVDINHQTSAFLTKSYPDLFGAVTKSPSLSVYQTPTPNHRPNQSGSSETPNEMPGTKNFTGFYLSQTLIESKTPPELTMCLLGAKYSNFNAWMNIPMADNLSPSEKNVKTANNFVERFTAHALHSLVTHNPVETALVSLIKDAINYTRNPLNEPIPLDELNVALKVPKWNTMSADSIYNQMPRHLNLPNRKHISLYRRPSETQGPSGTSESFDPFYQMVQIMEVLYLYFQVLYNLIE